MCYVLRQNDLTSQLDGRFSGPRQPIDGGAAAIEAAIRTSGHGTTVAAAT